MSARKIIVAVVCLFWFSVAAAQESSDIVITGAWVRATVSEPTTEGGGVSGAYMTIANESEVTLALTAAATTAAGVVEIHETQMQEGVMRMNPIERLVIPPGESAVLQPGGFHIMLMQLTRGLAPGDAISLTLTFEVVDAVTPGMGNIDVIVGVPALNEAPPASDFLITDVWARPTVTDMVGMGTAERPSADGGMVSPEGQAEATEMPESMPTGEMHMSGGGVSAAYLHLINLGEPDRLISAATDAAGLVEIHEMLMSDGVMRMNPIDGIDLPTNESVVLEPGGLHIMLMDLQRPLVPGEALTLTLTFESGTTLTIAVPIYDRLMMLP